MKRRIKRPILCAVLLLVCTGLLWQRDNIKAGISFLLYSSDELAAKMAESDKKMEESVAGMPELGIHPLTEEEREKLRDGSLSEEDALDRMLATPEPAPSRTDSEDTPEPSASQAGEAAPKPASPAAPKPDIQTAAKENEHKEKHARIAELIATVYVMRDSYVARLESIKERAIAEYTALPADRRTAAKKREFALRCIDEASALEATCDAEIGAIVSELTALLTEVGGDTSIASDIKAAYAEEKALKKAYYMDLYL